MKFYTTKVRHIKVKCCSKNFYRHIQIWIYSQFINVIIIICYLTKLMVMNTKKKWRIKYE